MTVQLRSQVCCGLSLLLVFTLVHIHFLGDPCLVHREDTAHPLGSALSIRAMTCLCFFHAVYAPIKVPFFVFPLEMPLAEYAFPDRDIPLLTFDIFHPPRA
ncbi:MAG: hypothetical protein OEW18_05345 [Candidatus Aminicenantes bacterium]|nr:hypothetical protein [Candidatus Aminicenantes bacterium]